MTARVWYRVHPALGLRRVPTAGFARPLTDAELGSKWEGLSDDERDRRQFDFYKHILTYLAQTYQPSFEVEVPWRWERDRFLWHAETPSRPAESRRDDFVLRGTLSVKAAEVLADLNPVIVTLSAEDQLLFTLGDAWSSATIALSPEEAVELQRELERLSLVS